VICREWDQAVEPEGKTDLLRTLEHGLHRHRSSGVRTVDAAPEEELASIRARLDTIQDLLDRNVVPLALAERAEPPVAALDLEIELLAVDRPGVAEALEHPRRASARHRAKLLVGDRERRLDRVALHLELPRLRIDGG